MKNKNTFNIGLSIVMLLTISCSKSLLYDAIKDSPQCSDKGGYWYNNKCWKGFDDEGIAESDIDSIVNAEIGIIKNTTITIDNQIHPLVAFLPLEKKEGIYLIAVYSKKYTFKTIIFPTGKKKIENGILETPALLFNGDAISGTMDKEPESKGTATINVIDSDNLDIEISGQFLGKKNNDKNFIFKPNETLTGAGTSQLEIKKNEAYLSGCLGTTTYFQIKELIKNHPKIKTIVMTHIAGSINDAINMHTGKLLRENKFTTKVLSNSDIASGGVDLFCAGEKRIVVKGAKIGVHSWCCINGLTAIKIPKDHPAHQYQLEYFSMALGAGKGSAFYFYTLESASFDSIHYMTDEEIKKWNIATTFIENN